MAIDVESSTTSTTTVSDAEPARDDTVSESPADEDGGQTGGRAPTSSEADDEELEAKLRKDAPTVASNKKNPDSSHKHNRWRKQQQQQQQQQQQDDHQEDGESSPTFSDDETALAAEGAHKESAKSKQQIDKTGVRQRQVKPSKSTAEAAAAAAAAKGSQAKARVASNTEPSTSANNNSNKYTIVKEKNIDDSSVDSLLLAAAVAAKPSSSSSSSSDGQSDCESNGQSERMMSSSGADQTSDAIRPQLSQVLPFKRPEDEQRNKYIPQQPLQEEQNQQQQQRQSPVAAEPEQATPDEEQLSFEAIASAISTTLSANNAQQLLATDQPLEAPVDNSAASDNNDNNNDGKENPSIMESADLTEVDSASDSSSDEAHDGVRSHSRRARLSVVSSENNNNNNNNQPIRRRLTPGEHVAEVIDHIVERRKQANGSDLSGPQIVVVAPVGGSQMMARSLTKASSELSPVADKLKNAKQTDAKVAAKKEAAKEASKLGDIKKSPASKSRQAKPLGGRLLGVSLAAGKGDASSGMKFSERVEVIEDDDSSALLFAKQEPQMQDYKSLISSSTSAAAAAAEATSPIKSQVDERLDAADELEESHLTLEQLLLDQPETSHVSSQAGEARLRSPRHNESPQLAFERYAPMSSILSASNRKSPGQENQARIYSAEKLIAEHLLKSKVQSAAAAQISNNVDQIKRSSGESGLEPATGRGPQQLAPAQPMKQVKVAPTTIKPHLPAAATTASSGQQDSRQQPLMVAASEQVHNMAAEPANSAYRSEGQRQLNNYQPVQQVAAQSQLMEPLQQQQQPQPQHLSQPQQQPQQVEQGQQQQQQQHQQVQPAESGQQPLPVFADQEYNVPAHMAESVIHKIQTSPLTVSMVNGQATLVGGMNHQQVPYHHPLYHQQSQFLPNSPQYPQYPQHPQQQQQQQHMQHQMMAAAASELQPMFQQVAPSQQQFAWQRVAAANNKQQQRKLSFFQRQGRSDTPAESWMTSKTISLNPAKAMANPLAQMAFKHLLSSLMGKSGSISLPRPDNLANIPIKLSFPSPLPAQSVRPHRPEAIPNSASPKMARSTDPQMQQQAINPIMMTNQNHPQSNIVVPPTGGPAQQPNLQQPGVNSAAPPSLNVGAARAGSDAMVHQETPDQDMEESYGQMPTYHMAPQGYGGEGRNYPYEGDHDKKSKGITFHFGGGPIGGGTQLITSPMGIFKHLMIPLLPNPRVNLNGKVVFGVVLEKSTAIGEPKKKYKFWGR